MKHILSLILFFQLGLGLSQNSNQTDGVIIMLKRDVVKPFLTQLTNNRLNNITYECLSLDSHIYLIKSESDDATLFNFLQESQGVISLEYNHRLEKRIKPNDNRINEQYYLDLIKAYQAWDITTGGKSFINEDVVIGIIDDGYEISHEDLMGNIYINPDEIPNDGKDNDNNGYIDDVNGFNVRTAKGTHDIKSHGTNILGLLGATGNNSKGISGINWKVKLLPVTIGNTVSEVIKGYEYLINERTLYNTSSGTKGANIVVTNYSGGLPKAFASSFPIWCGTYDKLGQMGILNVAAAVNENDNVEEVGDMPSTCTSPYLLVVSSTTDKDERYTSSGFGNISIDISAPGENILTTSLISNGVGTYKLESGTSVATPIVAGAAALMYSLQCEGISSAAKADGSALALAIKKALMDGSDLKTSLSGKTVSGGRLNIVESLHILLKDYCSTEFKKLNINSCQYYNNQLTVNYSSPDNQEFIVRIYDPTGKIVYSSYMKPPLIGKKEFTIPIFLDGMFYYCSIIQQKEIASLGFAAKDPSK